MVAQVIPIQVQVDPTQAERGSRRAAGALRQVWRLRGPRY